MKKTILLAVLGLAAVSGIGVYFVFQKASEDTEQITNLQDEKLSQEELGKMATEKAGSFDEARQAAQQTAELGVEKQVELWQTQLAHDSASVRMQAAQALVELEAKSGGAATKLLEAVSGDEKQDKDLRTFIQREWALKKLSALEGEALLSASRAMLKDTRAGFRMVALEKLAADGDVETRKLIQAMAKDDADEDVKDMAREILGLEDDDEDEDDEEEAEGE